MSPPWSVGRVGWGTGARSLANSVSTTTLYLPTRDLGVVGPGSGVAPTYGGNALLDNRRLGQIKSTATRDNVSGYVAWRTMSSSEVAIPWRIVYAPFADGGSTPALTIPEDLDTVVDGVRLNDGTWSVQTAFRRVDPIDNGFPAACTIDLLHTDDAGLETTSSYNMGSITASGSQYREAGQPIATNSTRLSQHYSSTDYQLQKPLKLHLKHAGPAADYFEATLGALFTKFTPTTNPVKTWAGNGYLNRVNAYSRLASWSMIGADGMRVNDLSGNNHHLAVKSGTNTRRLIFPGFHTSHSKFTSATFVASVNVGTATINPSNGNTGFMSVRKSHGPAAHAMDLRIPGWAIVAWARHEPGTSFLTFGTLIGKGDSAWRLQRDGANIAFGVTGWGDLKLPFDPRDGQWHMYCFQYLQNNGLYGWVDGAYLGGMAVPANALVPKNNFPVWIGENAQAQARGWYGDIGPISIHPEYYGQSFVDDLWNAGRQ